MLRRQFYSRFLILSKYTLKFQKGRYICKLKWLAFSECGILNSTLLQCGLIMLKVQIPWMAKVGWVEQILFPKTKKNLMITLSLYFIPKFFCEKIIKMPQISYCKILTLLGIQWKKEKERACVWMEWTKWEKWVTKQSHKGLQIVTKYSTMYNKT